MKEFMEFLHYQPTLEEFYPPLDDADTWNLKEHFEDKDIEEHANLWESAWMFNLTNWDRGGQSPALVETLREYPELFNGAHPALERLEGFVGHGFGHEAVSRGAQPPPQGRRKRALVPACGRGYDAVMLALVFGYDVWAVEISQTAMREADKWMIDLRNAFQGRSNGPPDFGWWVENLHKDKGNVKYCLGDFFDDGWRKRAKIEDMKFDLIFDYTVSPPQTYFHRHSSKTISC